MNKGHGVVYKNGKYGHCGEGNTNEMVHCINHSYILKDIFEWFPSLK